MAPAPPSLELLYRLLYRSYGPQGWWPARTPFEVMVGAILTQNTAWSSVEKAIASLSARAPLTPGGVLGLRPAALASAIRPSGYYRQKARRLRILARWYGDRFGGRVPTPRRAPTPALREELLSLEGVGPETADSILLYAFQRPSFVVDAYTRRVLFRAGILSREGSSYAAVQELFHRALPREAPLFNEYHALLVRHAKERCRKTRPACPGCPLAGRCR